MLKLYDMLSHQVSAIVPGLNFSLTRFQQCSDYAGAMSALGAFFAYARLVVVLAVRVASKLLSMGAAPFAALGRSVLGKPRVEAPDAETQLLGSEEAVQTDLVDEWVAVPDEGSWEAGGRELLDDSKKQCCEAPESSTEDELIELSDGEERPTTLHPAKRPSLSFSKHVSPSTALATHGKATPLL
ncbi:unnamed protein product [Phytophthora fragariaefolia]|uniref:Unnamed protein product n=1 Tax=Phytophthora fragariaefolia TaxID=1490495 RepID=A0A9W6WP91_9STRA|nr:unnamed protein product [Phytophthora fragariaefolia]